MQHVHFDGSHPVDVAFQHIQRNEVTTHVHAEPSPRKPRRVFDVHSRSDKSRRGNLNKLKERLQAVHYAERIRRREFRARGAHIEDITFVFTHLLYGFAWIIGVHHQRGIRRIDGFVSQGHAGFLRKVADESLDRAINARLFVSVEDYAKRPRDGERTRSHLQTRRHWH